VNGKAEFVDNVNVIRNGFMAPEFSLACTGGSMASARDYIQNGFLALCFFSGSKNIRIRNILSDLNHGLPKTSLGYEVNILAISPEKIHRLNNLKNDLGLSFPLLSDTRMRICAQYHVIDSASRSQAIHFSIFVIDDEFVIRYRFSESSENEFGIEDFRKKVTAII
jgi:peroxiredoxin